MINCDSCVFCRASAEKKRGKEIVTFYCHVQPYLIMGEDEEGQPLLERLKAVISPNDPCCKEYRPVIQ